ncbi:FAD-dependent thymidylate synthase [Streptomyces noursei]|uniref:FAD-dependent thymidylate synthase n=1 Tax=Streptomyces noursei TaxID=1971 RepID=UPI0019ADE569|nr:FAD-dependent thymidylate synthase [Streptomyces noursei]MCZ1019433.1 FAD-dependent thymidylate synthase [Streptomyces noursei]GGX08371.1 flavin-dependent thymidylate synthase [Streptomyces noursei]
MTEIRYRSDIAVELIDHMGGDRSIVRAARVSSGAAGTPEKDRGLLNMLARDRHGSPFESVVLQFKVECPIFVAREWFRHRVSSFNETSGRYKVLEPEFYVPKFERPLKQIGKPGAYEFEHVPYESWKRVQAHHESAAIRAWESYDRMIKNGVAREVARNVLPLSLYTSFSWTVNLRSAMNFLSLRWAHVNSTVPTFPLYEIQQGAVKVERHAQAVAPIAMEMFNKHGRVTP